MRPNEKYFLSLCREDSARARHHVAFVAVAVARRRQRQASSAQYVLGTAWELGDFLLLWPILYLSTNCDYDRMT